MLSPLLASTDVVASSAAIPDPVATAAVPPDSSASRSSSIATVGLVKRV